MSSFLSELADYIHREGIGTSSGASVNIFVGKYPDEPDNCIALLGLLPQKVPNIYVSDFEYPRFQVIVRNTAYVTAEAKIRQVRELLHDKLTIVTENFICKYIQADSDIVPLGEDDKGRAEFSINFSTQILNEDSGS